MSQIAADMIKKQARNSTESYGGVLQRKCDTCRKKKKPILQRSAIRTFIVRRFGHDFSRGHMDAKAADSVRAVNALFTLCSQT